jgi:hypothetical protein
MSPPHDLDFTVLYDIATDIANSVARLVDCARRGAPGGEALPHIEALYVRLEEYNRTSMRIKDSWLRANRNVGRRTALEDVMRGAYAVRAAIWPGKAPPYRSGGFCCQEVEEVIEGWKTASRRLLALQVNGDDLPARLEGELLNARNNPAGPPPQADTRPQVALDWLDELAPRQRELAEQLLDGDHLRQSMPFDEVAVAIYGQSTTREDDLTKLIKRTRAAMEAANAPCTILRLNGRLSLRLID